MKDELVELETAILAKEKGFDINCDWGVFIYKKEFSRDGNKIEIGTIEPALNINNKDTNGSDIYDTVAKPTQTLLQKWLREVHNIHIGMRLRLLKNNIYACEVIYRDYQTYAASGGFEEVLEKALKEALSLIKI
jgi:hypothetical protein